MTRQIDKPRQGHNLGYLARISQECQSSKKKKKNEKRLDTVRNQSVGNMTSKCNIVSWFGSWNGKISEILKTEYS